MNACDDLIAQLGEQLPDICTVNDLIRVGIISHRNVMEQYRRKKIGPPFLRLSERKIFYPKQGVLKWLKENSYAGGEKATQNRGKIADISGEPELA